jgi:DNA-binding protein HU-beta
MAKAKRRLAKKVSKRSKVRTASKRKKGAKRAAPKKTRSKVRKVPRSARKVTAKKRTAPKSAARKAVRKQPTAELPVEDTIIDVVDEPAPGVVRVTEYETIRTVRPGSGDESEDDQE